MNVMRHTAVLITCLALVFPLAVFSPCCCASGELAANCSCATADSHSCCCGSTAETDSESCPEDSQGCCTPACHCTVPNDAEAVPVAEIRQDVAIAAATWPQAILTAAPIPAILFWEVPDRPVVSHNRRQATLCVWTK